MKANIPFENLNLKRDWSYLTDLERLGFLCADILFLTEDTFTIAVDKSNTHYGIDYSDSKFISYCEFYIDKSESTWKYNLEELLKSANVQLNQALKVFNTMKKDFKKEKALRTTIKINERKFKETFVGMELPKEFFSKSAKRRYDILYNNNGIKIILYMRKAGKLLKKFKLAIKENQKTINKLSKIKAKK